MARRPGLPGGRRGEGATLSGRVRSAAAARPGPATIRREEGPGDSNRPIGARRSPARCVPPAYRLRTLHRRLDAVGQSPAGTSAVSVSGQSRLRASRCALSYGRSGPHRSMSSPCGSQSESSSFIPASALARVTNRNRLLGRGRNCPAQGKSSVV